MIAFNYVDKFDELAGLPQLKKLQVLEIAHRRVMKARKNFVNAGICLALGLLVGIAPRAILQMPAVVEGLLLGVGILAAGQCFRRLYERLLLEKVRELLSTECP